MLITEPVRIAHEEPAQAPLFVREWVDDLGSGGASAFVHGVNIVHLDGHIRVNVCLDVEFHHAQLHFGLIRPEEEDPIQTLATVETDHVIVEGPALVKALRQYVRLDPLDTHGGSLGRNYRAVFIPDCLPGDRSRRRGVA